VALLNNLPTTLNVDQIFTLCSVYGKVLRAKILYNKRSSALVEFAHPDHAASAAKHLQGCPVYEQTLHIVMSKHNGIKVSNKEPTTEEENLTKDFSSVDTRLHRFSGKGQDAKALSQACPPSAVLHLSNIPSTVAHGEIRALFEPHGPVVNFKPLARKGEGKQDKMMALVELPTPQAAVTALIALHNYPMADDAAKSSGMRVSFTKSTI